MKKIDEGRGRVGVCFRASSSDTSSAFGPGTKRLATPHFKGEGPRAFVRGLCKGNKDPNSAFLLSSFPGAQEGGVEDDHRSLPPQQISCAQALQDVDGAANRSVHFAAHVGIHNGCKGRLSKYPDGAVVPSFPGVFSRDLPRGLQKLRFTVLPFGLSQAPWLYSRVMKPIKVHLRLRDLELGLFGRFPVP